MRIHPLGIYEKALPKDLTWKELCTEAMIFW